MKSGICSSVLCFTICLSLPGCSSPRSVSYRCDKDPAHNYILDGSNKPIAKPCNQKKHIVIFLDASGMTYKKSRTNIKRFYEIISNQDRDDIAVYYDEGVGAGFLFKLEGNLFGAGFGRKIRQAYRFIATRYNEGDNIYIFGYSRGAAQARSLAGMVKFVGLLDKSVIHAKTTSEESSEYIFTGDEVQSEPYFEVQSDSFFTGEPVFDAYKVYLTSPHKDFPETLAAFREAYKDKIIDDVPIRVVGVWDTLQNLGIPEIDPDENAPKDKSHRLELHDNTDYAFHVLALDERRVSFQPILWNKQDLKSNNASREEKQLPNQVLEQVWFVGNHGDVGGGYGDTRELAGLSLNWMLAQLEKTKDYNLLPMNYRVNENPLGKRHDSHVGIFDRIPKKTREEFQCGQDQKIHRSVIQRIEAKALLNDGIFKYWPQQAAFQTVNKSLPILIDADISECFGIAE